MRLGEDYRVVYRVAVLQGRPDRRAGDADHGATVPGAARGMTVLLRTLSASAAAGSAVQADNLFAPVAE